MAKRKANRPAQRTALQLLALVLISQAASISAISYGKPKPKPSYSDSAPAPAPKPDYGSSSSYQSKGSWKPKLKGSDYDPSKVDWAGVVSACRALGTWEKRLYSFFIRASFHDSMSFKPEDCDAQGGGCGGTDSSLLLSVEEMTRPENNMHKFSYYTSLAAKKIASFYDCSVADVLAVCGGVSITALTNERLKVVGGKGKDFKVGRYDSDKAAPPDLLPGAEDKLDKFARFWIDRDFEMDQAVALMGTHSLLQGQVCAEKLGAPLCDPSRPNTCRQVLQFKLDNHYFQDVCSSDSSVIKSPGGGQVYGGSGGGSKSYGGSGSSYKGGSSKSYSGGSKSYGGDDGDDDGDSGSYSGGGGKQTSYSTGGKTSTGYTQPYGGKQTSTYVPKKTPTYTATPTYTTTDDNDDDDDDDDDSGDSTSSYGGSGNSESYNNDDGDDDDDDDGDDDDDSAGGYTGYRRRSLLKHKKYGRKIKPTYRDDDDDDDDGSSYTSDKSGKYHGACAIYRGYQPNPRCTWTSEEFRAKAGFLDGYYPGSKFNYKVTWVNTKYDVPWPYTTQDGWLGQACQGRYKTDSENEAVRQIGQAMRTFSNSRSEWERVLYKAYHKMVVDWAEWSSSAFMIDGSECPSGYSKGSCKTAFKNGVAWKIDV